MVEACLDYTESSRLLWPVCVVRILQMACPKITQGFFFPLFGQEFLVLPNFEILLAVYFRKAALVFLKNMNSMNPREPVIGFLLTNSAFHAFAVSPEGLCDCCFTIQVRSHDIHMLSKPFSHQRIVLPRPAVDSVLRNWNHSCVSWAWEWGEMLCIAQNHVSSVCAGSHIYKGMCQHWRWCLYKQPFSW